MCKYRAQEYTHPAHILHHPATTMATNSDAKEQQLTVTYNTGFNNVTVKFPLGALAGLVFLERSMLDGRPHVVAWPRHIVGGNHLRVVRWELDDFNAVTGRWCAPVWDGKTGVTSEADLDNANTLAWAYKIARIVDAQPNLVAALLRERPARLRSTGKLKRALPPCVVAPPAAAAAR